MTIDRDERVPTLHSILRSLSKRRLEQLGRDVAVQVGSHLSRADQAELLEQSGQVELRPLVDSLGRDELKVVCRGHGLDDSGRARQELLNRVLTAAGAQLVTEPPAAVAEAMGPSDLPAAGDVVVVRHRQWMVEHVAPPSSPGDATLVQLSCLDDDNQGQPLAVLWELELGARIQQPAHQGLGDIQALDEPRTFGAYYHALKWSSVTASRGDLFQAPFRAGIRLMDHQMSPLLKALALPRSNLFIADDVGLGKTIEAGLVLQELVLRQRVDFVLIVCPASVALQWRDEMARRFGRHFELYNRSFVAARRRERGFSVNPWTTHQRFIVTYQTLRRPETFDGLLQRLETRLPRSLLILDEAHHAAPASASKYAVDSGVTRMVRNLAPRFDNRLFLSATPHNGHSNSFSALLEVLDRQRFMRGVPVRGPQDLAPVMVRRLKEDLRQLGQGDFPERHVVEVQLSHTEGGWTAHEVLRTSEGTSAAAGTGKRLLGEADAGELELARLLADYTALLKPHLRVHDRGVFVQLQQRLSSSVEAFARSLQVHVESFEEGRFGKAAFRDALAAKDSAQQGLLVLNDDEYGSSDDDLEAAADTRMRRASARLGPPTDEARALQVRMVGLADRIRHAPDAKVRALVAWLAEHLCPGVSLDPTARQPGAPWTERRVIIFTEWADTKRWLKQALLSAIEGTDDADRRVLELHGGMGDETRAEVQRAFNAKPSEHPVRILLATDAAREGINLQAHCTDLFHFDVPWNPARMEQRNGRIDRTLQPAKVVRCHYFRYMDRPEDKVLAALVEKVDRIRSELGSLSTVVMERWERVLQDGIDEGTEAALDEAETLPERSARVQAEFEASSSRDTGLQEEIAEAGRIRAASEAVLAFRPELLRDALDVGLQLSGAAGPLAPQDGDPDAEAWIVPELPDDWQPTLDTLRPPRKADETFWQWRDHPPEPVVFQAPGRLDTHQVHLHLEHPFVKRVMARFFAQGFSAHDLSRVSVLLTRRDSVVRVIAFGRLSLFGRGATRLHEELIAVAGRWTDGDDGGSVRPFADRADRATLDQFEDYLASAPSLESVPASVQQRVRRLAGRLFAQLWPHVEQEADSRRHDIERLLAERGSGEAAALEQILRDQRAAIESALSERQAEFDFKTSEADQREQLALDREAMEDRRRSIEHELATEPAELAALYEVLVRRVEPVGLVVLWPETRS